MALAVAQATSVPSSGTGTGVFQAVSSINISFGSDTASGNLIVVTITGYDGVGGSVSSITDSKSNSYTKAYEGSDGNGGYTACFYSENITGGASHTVTVNCTGTIYGVASCIEVSGAATSSSVDVNTVDDTTTISASTSYSISSGSLAQADEIVFATFTKQENATITNPSSPWTALYARDDWSNDHCGCAVYQIVSATDSVTSTWTFASTTVAQASGIISFKQAAAGGGGGGNNYANKSFIDSQFTKSRFLLAA